jgi:hypothetical protein
MSDSFADLWNSTAPSKPVQSQQSRTLGSATPTVAGQQRKPQNDVFSMLAASTSSSRSLTPSYSPQPVQKTSSLGSTSVSSGVKPVQKSASNGEDAFSDLFSGSTPGAPTSTNMTMAQRAALAEKQRLEAHAAQKTSNIAQTSAWAGLDALGDSSAFRSASPAAQSTGVQPEDDWGLTFDAPAKSVSSGPTSSTAKTPAPARDNWDFDNFISKPAAVKAVSSKVSPQSQSLWDLDEFSNPAASSSLRASPAPPQERSSAPGSFDFGDREDGLLGDRSDGEDDILGELSKPVQSKPTRSVSMNTYLYELSNGGSSSEKVLSQEQPLLLNRQ